jgi:hypothetical protein
MKSRIWALGLATLAMVAGCAAPSSDGVGSPVHSTRPPQAALTAKPIVAVQDDGLRFYKAADGTEQAHVPGVFTSVGVTENHLFAFGISEGKIVTIGTVSRAQSIVPMDRRISSAVAGASGSSIVASDGYQVFGVDAATQHVKSLASASDIAPLAQSGETLTVLAQRSGTILLGLSRSGSPRAELR